MDIQAFEGNFKTIFPAKRLLAVKTKGASESEASGIDGTRAS